MCPRSRGAFRPRLLAFSPSQINRGRREDRVTAAPGALAPERLREGRVTTGTADITPAFPAQWFTAYSALLCLQNLPECANGRFSQNRPSLDLSPKCSQAARACRGAWDRSGVFLNPNSCMGYEPERARKGMDDGTKRSGCRRT